MYCKVLTLSYTVVLCNKTQDRNCRYKVELRPVRATIVSVGKVVSITCPESVTVDLRIQHALHTHHIVLCGLSSCTVSFPHNLIKGTILGRKVIKAIPLQAWTGPKGFRRLRLPDFKTIGT